MSMMMKNLVTMTTLYHLLWVQDMTVVIQDDDEYGNFWMEMDAYKN